MIAVGFCDTEPENGGRIPLRDEVGDAIRWTVTTDDAAEPGLEGGPLFD